MRKWIISGIVAAVLVIAATAAVLNLNHLIERNKGYLLAQVEQVLGRKVSVSDVEATLFTGIGLRLMNFSMSDDPAYSSNDFVRAKNLQVNLKFWPLLNKQIQVKRVILEEPVIHIVRNSQGKFNFSTIGHQQEAEEKKEKPDKKDGAGGDGGQSGFLLSLVDISDGDIRYVDRRDGAELQVKQIDLELQDFDFDRPFSVKLAAALFADKQNVELSSIVGPLNTETALNEVFLDGKINIDPLDLSRLNAALPAAKKALPRDLDLSGVFRVTNLKFKGSLTHLSLNGEIEGTNGSLRYGKAFQKSAGIPLSLTADVRYDGEKLTINKSRLTLHTMELATSGDIQLDDHTMVNLSLDSRPASLEGWGQIVPALSAYELGGTMNVQATVRGHIGKGAVPQIKGTLGLQNAKAKPPEFPRPIENLDTKINFTGQSAAIDDMSLSLGKSRIHLAAAIERFTPLTVTYKMSTPEIWPADYQEALPPERNADVLRDLQSEGRFTLGGANVVYEGKIRSAGGTLYNVAYKGLDTALALADQVATIRSLRVNMLQGSVQMEGEYSFKEPAPSFVAASKIQGIDIKELYYFLDPEAEQDIRGRMRGEMKLSGRGKNWEAIKPTLRGQATMEVLQGALLNFNIAEGALSGITGIPGLTSIFNPALREKYPETFIAKDTEFDELKANFDVADGRVNVKNLRMAAAEFLVHGNGWVDFTRRIDFPATLVFSERLSADLAQSAREVKYLLNKEGRLELPLTIKGRLPNVKPRPDVKYLGEVVQRGFIRKGAEELQNRFLGRDRSGPRDEPALPDGKPKKRDSTEDLIRRGLESLFKR